MEVAQLQYEPSARARPVVIEHDGGVMRIVVAMQGVYAPTPEWVRNLDVFSLIVAPIWFVGALLIHTLLRLPKPPRAVFEVSGNQLKMSMCDRISGETTMISFPRSAVVEARANRYENGLWMDVPGYVKNTYLTDLPRETIDRLEAALRWALGGEAEAAGAGGGTEPRV